MKKILTTSLAALFACNVSNAQKQIPDGGFESDQNTWELKKSAKGDYWNFRKTYFLSTLNLLYTLSGDEGEAPLTAFKEIENSHSGNYAIKLVSNTMQLGSEVIFLPGVTATIEIDIYELYVELGNDYTDKPHSLYGYMRYAPVEGDSAAIEVQLTQYDSRTNTHTTIGIGKQIFYDAESEWTKFEIPIDYISGLPHNRVILIFSASAGYDFTSFETLLKCKGQVGSTLWIDDVGFGFEQGVKEILMPKVKMNVYPNPSSDEILIDIEQYTNGSVFIYDNMGRKVGDYPISGIQKNIAVQDYAAGSYLINIVENDNVIASGRFLKE